MKSPVSSRPATANIALLACVTRKSRHDVIMIAAKKVLARRPAKTLYVTQRQPRPTDPIFHSTDAMARLFLRAHPSFVRRGVEKQ